MRPLSEIYRALVAAGATPEVIALAIEAFESGGQSGMSGGQSGGHVPESGGRDRMEADAHERRKAWDRAYRAKRRGVVSGGQTAESGGQSGGQSLPPASPLVPPLEVSPAPLPKTPPIIPPPVRDTDVSLTAREAEPRGVAALRNEAVARRAAAKRWPEFKAAYPKREGSQDWPLAEKKYVALVASGVAEEDLIGGAKAYASHLRETGNFGTRFVKQARSWLNSGGWNDEYLTGTGRRVQSELMDTLDRHRREAEARAGHRAPGQGDGSSWDIDATALPG